MKNIVICVDNKNLPLGANLVKNEEYEFEEEFVNNFDQRCYMLKNVTNTGRTKYGLPWIGYRANRFKKKDSVVDAIMEEVNYNLN